MTPDPLPPIELVWEDTQSYYPRWQDRDDEELTDWCAAPPILIRTVGLLLHETERALVIVQSVSDEQMLHLVKIPKAAVRERRELT